VKVEQIINTNTNKCKLRITVKRKNKGHLPDYLTPKQVADYLTKRIRKTVKVRQGQDKVVYVIKDYNFTYDNYLVHKSITDVINCGKIISDYIDEQILTIDTDKQERVEIVANSGKGLSIPKGGVFEPGYLSPVGEGRFFIFHGEKNTLKEVKAAFELYQDILFL